MRLSVHVIQAAKITRMLLKAEMNIQLFQQRVTLKKVFSKLNSYFNMMPRECTVCKTVVESES